MDGNDGKPLFLSTSRRRIPAALTGQPIVARFVKLDIVDPDAVPHD